MLERAIGAGSPVLVGLDGDDDEPGHWSVVYGYSKTHVFLADPSVRRAIRARTTRADFRKRFADHWAMVVSA